MRAEENFIGFDKEKYKDCLNEDGEFDYDKLKTRLTAENYEIKNLKDRGELVSKSSVVACAKSISTICKKGFESVPQQYTSVLLGKIEDMKNIKFSEKEKTEIRITLEKVPSLIMSSLQKEIEALTND